MRWERWDSRRRLLTRLSKKTRVHWEFLGLGITIGVKEYGEWHASNVSDEALLAAFRQVSSEMLADGPDIEQIYKDQDPEFFVGKGIKIGIARCFVDNIRDWAENMKQRLSWMWSREPCWCLVLWYFSVCFWGWVAMFDSIASYRRDGTIYCELMFSTKSDFWFHK